MVELALALVIVILFLSHYRWIGKKPIAVAIFSLFLYLIMTHSEDAPGWITLAIVLPLVAIHIFMNTSDIKEKILFGYYSMIFFLILSMMNTPP